MQLQSNQFVIIDKSKNSRKILNTFLVFVGIAVLYFACMIFVVLYPGPLPSALLEKTLGMFLASPPLLAILFICAMMIRIVRQPTSILEITDGELIIAERKKEPVRVPKNMVAWVQIVEKYFGRGGAAYCIRIEAPGQKFLYTFKKKSDAVLMQEMFVKNGYTVKNDLDITA